MNEKSQQGLKTVGDQVAGGVTSDVQSGVIHQAWGAQEVEKRSAVLRDITVDGFLGYTEFEISMGNSYQDMGMWVYNLLLTMVGFVSQESGLGWK